MMQTAMMKAMRVSISNVLESMFFVMVQIAEEKCPLQEWFPRGRSLLGATLKFEGPAAGAFYFWVPVDMADDITSNFLGLNQKNILEEQRKDTVKEALNMIGGGMLSILDQDGSFKLGIPEMLTPGRLTGDRLENFQGNVVLVETGDNRLAAGMVLDRPPG